MLVTRPEPGAAQTASRVAALGYSPVVAPLLTIRPLPADLPEPAGLQAILVSSGSAVDALPPSFRRLPLLAVGDATAERARRAGYAPVDSASGNAASLANLVARRCDRRGAPLLMAVGRAQGAGLESALLQVGFRVERREVYTAEPTELLPDAAQRALAAQELRAALFFSAETARAFVGLVRNAQLDDQLHDVDALAISNGAAEALAPLRWRRVRAALHPNQDELLALLQ